VYLTDSSSTSILYQDSALTDAAGLYSFTIPASVTTGTMIVSTQACGARIKNQNTFTGSSLTLNLAVCSSSTATVSGDVSYTWGHASPVYNQKVYLLDSTSTHYNVDSTLTDYAGHYSFAVPPAFMLGKLKVSTNLCGSPMSQSLSYAGASIIVPTFYGCYGPAAVLYGTTRLGGAANTGPTMIYLIRKAYDATLLDTTLRAIDSFTTIGSTGNFYKTYTSSVYTLSDSGRGRLLLKAALQPSHPSYGAYLPGYHDSALNWAGAVAIDSSNIVNPTAFHFYAAVNINMPAGINPGGPGFIGGSVLLGANKSTAVGDPLSSRILILTTAAGKPVAFTYSNTSGQFSFSNLAYGTYHIYGDAWGKANPPLVVTLTAAYATIDNIIFEENSTSFKGHINSLSVSNATAITLLSITPNPARNAISIHGLDAIKGDKTVVIRDMNGAVLSTTAIHEGGSPSVNIADMPSGIYSVQVRSGDGAADLRFIKL
jgi:hypothetical protein